MRKIYYYLTSLILFLSTACNEQIFKEESTNEDSDKNTERYYVKAKTAFTTSLANTYRNLGIDEVSTRNHPTPKVLDIIKNLSEEELKNIINSSYFQEVIKNQEETFDEWISIFFNHFSTDDYVLLSKTVDEYLEQGGNNVNRVVQLSSVFSDEVLKILFINTCMYADCLADNNFWLKPKVESSTRRVSGNEINCRTAFWNKLRLISLTATAPEAVELACLSGPLLPTIEELEAAAAVLGAAGAAWDYYTCTRNGIH